MSGGNELSRAVKSGYLKAARTVICQYCSKVRSTQNLYQTKPRIKCMDCFNKAGGYK